MSTTTTTTTTIEKFQRAVNGAAGIYYRQDKGLLTGRNATSTDETLRSHVRHARELLSAEVNEPPNSGSLFDWLDAHPRFAAKWDRIERRYYGLHE